MSDGLISFVAKTYHGLESILAEEIKNLGGKHVEPRIRAVTFRGTMRTMYRVNYESRTAIRVLMPLASFDISEPKDIYDRALQIPWDKYMHLEQTFRINKFIKSDFFNNTNYAALLCKDAIADYFYRIYGKRPSVSKEKPDLSIDLHLNGTRVGISLDSSGDSLHKRGYKKATVRAPISEVLAAGMLLIAKASEYHSILNPMCGSGTIAIESIMIKRRIPPQINRKAFGFMRWPSFDEEQWKLILQGAKMRIKRDIAGQIVAYDKAYSAINSTKINLHKAGLYRNLDLSQQDFFYYKYPAKDRSLVIMNPPYDKRLPLRESKEFYGRIGKKLKSDYKGHDVWIIADAEGKGLLNLGLKPTQSSSLYNGPIKCYYNHYAL